MRSSYGKEMEGASSDAKEIEGKSPAHTPYSIHLNALKHHRLHDETRSRIADN